jgi:hypothetical protein
VSTAGVAGNNMEMETKFLRLRTPVEVGSRFGDWSVCWLGGWAKHRLYYLVMLVKLKPQLLHSQQALTRLTPKGRDSK